MVSSGKPFAPRTQKQTKKNEYEDTAAITQKNNAKTEPETGEKREFPERDVEEKKESKEVKKPKTESADPNKYAFTSGVIERGHIYFFYRPKVEHEEVHSIDDVRNLMMLLVPGPPEFSVHGASEAQSEDASGADEMNLVAQGADAAPATASTKDKKHYRLIIIGKKSLPGPEHGKHDPFWATVVTVGKNLHDLEEGLEEKSYETKTRGTRHVAPARLAGRGVYAIVNSEGNVPSKNSTHLGYHLSHPTELGDVQKALGIHIAASFVIQVKNPDAEVSTGQRVGLPKYRRANYSEEIMKNVFGRGEKGRSSVGLRFTNCNNIELLDHEGAELLLIPARTGAEGNDQSLGEGRGEALEQVGRRESEELVDQIFKELALHKDRFPAEPLKGVWI
ncbi:hypothetical protein M405DRAFT_726601 [Rhizopogon salebrosus TDB-379]|nr:hypothetical protein M405DRAFT_726601 [Rhizopogon salebrosus TDB-379]